MLGHTTLRRQLKFIKGLNINFEIDKGYKKRQKKGPRVIVLGNDYLHRQQKLKGSAVPSQADTCAQRNHQVSEGKPTE